MRTIIAIIAALFLLISFHCGHGIKVRKVTYQRRPATSVTWFDDCSTVEVKWIAWPDDTTRWTVVCSTEIGVRYLPFPLWRDDLISK